MGRDRCRRGNASDFSGTTGSRDLFVSEVVHEGFVAVDEEGTEAESATAGIVPTSAMPQEPVEVTVDGSFVFLIHDGGTGTVLFVRRVPDPRA